MKILETYLRNLNLFSEVEIQKCLALFHHRISKKGEYFIIQGQVSQEVAFVERGVWHSSYSDESGTETTYCFRFPKDMITAYSSFISGKPSIENLQALSDSVIWTAQKKELMQLADQSYNWMKFFRMVAEQNYIELEERIIQLQSKTAQERYLHLLQTQPQYIQQIPLRYLASYLGITQRHLSRIRKEITF